MTIANPKPNQCAKQLHVETPLIESHFLSSETGNEVLLKLDNLQPGGSFKIRGHGHLLSTHLANGKTHFISSSGGNAGMAVALAGRTLSARVTIIVPDSTPAFMIARLERAHADVIVHGAVWDAADIRARELAASDPTAVHVSPFDDELLWEGHASLVHEVHAQLCGRRPSAIVVSVGGGGLFLGVQRGLSQLGWNEVPIITAETQGANSFEQMVRSGDVVTLDSISSIAKSLGALAVSQACADVVRKGFPVEPVVVTDREAVEACSLVAVQHRFLVEPACGAAIAAVQKIGVRCEGPVVVVLCGGNMASPDLLREWVAATGATEASL